MRDMVSHNDSDVIPEEWNIAIASLNVTSFAPNDIAKDQLSLARLKQCLGIVWLEW
ncbi:hypothetical protein DPMN_177181 [Dreissena polymorpha]|uniref:Uncharacterized protein n=1 Tax=Dreissena polymorpha TaxID=45954 RepID=A0A9D4IIT0_DREPO|nr:hypothetical protein DPMN_177181 [Dreissena polymorpha]